jgi:hypothetical protein
VPAINCSSGKQDRKIKSHILGKFPVIPADDYLFAAGDNNHLVGKKAWQKMKSHYIIFIFFLVIILLLGYMVYQREKEISILKSLTSPTTTLSAGELQVKQLLDVAQTDEIVKEFTASGGNKIYLDILDENDFNKLPAIYKNITRENLLQLNITKGSRALLVIMTPEKVLKVVPVTNLRIT